MSKVFLPKEVAEELEHYKENFELDQYLSDVCLDYYTLSQATIDFMFNDPEKPLILTRAWVEGYKVQPTPWKFLVKAPDSWSTVDKPRYFYKSPEGRVIQTTVVLVEEGSDEYLDGFYFTVEEINKYELCGFKTEGAKR